MQEQINAIKQLIEINNMTESQIDGILIKALGQQASWENCSAICELSDFEDQFCEEEISNEIRWIMELLWRSRIDLNDAKHHAEIAGLDELLAKKDFTEIALTAFAKSRLEALLETRNAEIENLKLALDAAKKPADDLQMECDQLRRDLRERDRVISVLDTEVDSLRLDVKERDQHVSLLKNQIMGFRSNLKADCADIIQQCKEDDIKDHRIEDLERDLTEARKIIIENAEYSEQKIAKRDRQIEELQTEINRLKSWLKKREDQLQVLWANDGKKSKTADPKPNVNDLTVSLKFSNNVILERNRQIEELQITLKNHREQFDDLTSHFEVTLKAIAMNLDGLKGARKPDETREVNGVMTTFRNYDDNLTHHHKTIIIENVQRAIAEEAKKLKRANLKDFSFDEIPF